jgi:hypothetical protein
VRRVRTRQRAAGRTVLDPVALDAAASGRGPGQSQAYCGPGDGRRWRVEPGHRPRDVVELQTASGVWSYRLLVHPETQGPARDHQGRYPYLPVAGAGSSAVRSGGRA